MDNELPTQTPASVPGALLLELNPSTDKVEVKTDSSPDTDAPAGPPPRSWSRTTEDDKKWDSTFEFDGATVYLKSLTKAQRVILKVKQEANAKVVKELQGEMKKAQTDEDKEAIGELMAETQMAYMVVALKMTIRYWENGPLPFSVEAIEDLPFEIMFKWVQNVVQKSQIGITEAEMLKNN